jgi:hypothetical protein
MPWRWLAARSSLRALHGMKQYEDFFDGLSNSKHMVFNMKKMLNNGVDLTLWQRGKKKRS